MPILYNTTTANGVATSHKLTRFELKGQDQLTAWIASYSADDVLLWMSYVDLPLTVLQEEDGIEKAIATQWGGEWVAGPADDDVERARTLKWQALKAQRASLESAGFDVPGIGGFDSDAESRVRIIGAAVAAKIASDAEQPYVIDWTLADNTVAELSAAQVIAVGFALLAYVNAIHQASRAAREALDAAETVEAVNAVALEFPAPPPTPAPEEPAP